MKMTKSALLAAVSIYFMILSLLIMTLPKLALIVTILSWIVSVILSVVVKYREEKNHIG